MYDFIFLKKFSVERVFFTQWRRQRFTFPRDFFPPSETHVSRRVNSEVRA